MRAIHYSIFVGDCFFTCRAEYVAELLCEILAEKIAYFEEEKTVAVWNGKIFKVIGTSPDDLCEFGLLQNNLFVRSEIFSKEIWMKLQQKDLLCSKWEILF